MLKRLNNLSKWSKSKSILSDKMLLKNNGCVISFFLTTLMYILFLVMFYVYHQFEVSDIIYCFFTIIEVLLCILGIIFTLMSA